MAAPLRGHGNQSRDPSESRNSAGSLGVVGPHREMPMFGVQMTEPGAEEEVDFGLTGAEEDGPEVAGSRFAFTMDEDRLTTSCRRNGRKGESIVILHGILRIQKRLIQHKPSHSYLKDGHLASTSSPLKEAVTLRAESVCLVVVCLIVNAVTFFCLVGYWRWFHKYVAVRYGTAAPYMQFAVGLSALFYCINYKTIRLHSQAKYH
ncbi:hypothetical protein BV898_14111 [Hypsibius exemplaris]|uniref:Uncharacterized protein n=1 Tax=Hypsibius exemplaris TaxID=2072580 RepID=A0A1W0W8V2_HYPEX|nr:hypothetical protein BV898_14111 [Hypsibius exemplaris]